ncbi:hypothetical protein [Mucilaginibacter sp. HD30]
MEMQDREFDQLFNSKLNDFELEPSADVWQNIDRELNGKKAKRSIMPYLSIAASVIVLASVSLWFFNQKQQKTEQPVKLVKRVKAVKPQTYTKEAAAPVSIVADRLEDAIATSTKIKTASGLNKTQVTEQAPRETAITLTEATTQKPEPVLAVVPMQKATASQAAVPANDIPLSTGLLADNAVEYMEKPIDEAKDTPIKEKPPVKKKAHGLGGLFNTIIAAVDKREDKLIEFTDAGDDEGTRVTGVNLGILKIKKQ